MNQIAIITGGSRGLGRSMALHLADAGVDVLLTYNSKEKQAREVADAIVAKGRKAAIVQLDVSKSKGFGAFVDAVKNALTTTWGRDRFDFLVNNAGTGIHASFMETTEEQFDEMVNIHLRATFFLTQRLVPLMVDGGRVLNVSTGLARFTFPGYAAYASMKGGIEVLTRYMAKELGGRQIRVNVLAPGAIATDFGGGAVRDNAQLNAGIAQQTALGRVGEADDIGKAVTALLSPSASWITGQRIEASGGMFL